MNQATFHLGSYDRHVAASLGSALRRYILDVARDSSARDVPEIPLNPDPVFCRTPTLRVWFNIDGTEERGPLTLFLETDGRISAGDAFSQAVDALLDDTTPSFQQSEFDESRGRFTSVWLRHGRATTLGHLLETVILFRSDPDATRNVDVSFGIESGDFLDHPREQRFILDVQVQGGCPPRQRTLQAIDEIRGTLRSIGQCAGDAGAPGCPAFFPPPPPSLAERRFERIVPAIPPEDPLAVQTESFHRFLSNAPDTWGLGWLLHQALNIDAGAWGKMELVDWSAEDPSADPAAARRTGRTWSRPISITIRLTRPGAGAVEQRLRLAEIPQMTERGTFLVRGREVISIGELVTAPGIYVSYSPRHQVPEVRVVPHHGLAIRFGFARDGSARVFFDNSRPVPAATFLAALGHTGDPTCEGLPADVLKTSTSLPRAEAMRATVEAITSNAVEDPEAAFSHALVEPLAWNLGQLGRRRLNQRLGTTSRVTAVEAADVVAILRELVRARDEHCPPDDLDHAGSLVVKSVGDSLFDHLRPAFRAVRQAFAACLLGGSESPRQEDGDSTGSRSGASSGIHPGSPSARDLPLRGTMASVTSILANHLGNALDTFFIRCPLVRDLNTTNPLAILSQARQVTRAGPGGLDRDRAGLLSRYIHPSHYGRFCIIDTPEGENIGLLRSLSLYARLDADGFILAPYLRVRSGRLTREVVYLPPSEEERFYLAAGDVPRNAEGVLLGDKVLARRGYDYHEIAPTSVDFVGVSPHEILGLPAHMIPLVEFDDPNRSLMGANMSRQAVEVLRPEPPLVVTGYEGRLVPPAVLSLNLDGTAPSSLIHDGSGQSPVKVAVVAPVSRPEVFCGPERRPGDRRHDVLPRVNSGVPCALRDSDGTPGPSPSDRTSQARLAPGRNLLVGYLPWEGYNFEDGLVISERVAREGLFTSVHVREFTVDVRTVPGHTERLTRDVPGVDHDLCAALDERGIARSGATVRSGDLLVGKVARDFQGLDHDVSLSVPPGCEGRVLEAAVQTPRLGYLLPPDVEERARVVLQVERRLKVGDKLANRHGAKGVIAAILPEEDMPCLPDGMPLDMIASPLGVPSRMNIGQLMEAHLSLAARRLGIQIVSPPLNGATPGDLKALLREAGLPEDGRVQLYDGRTGKPFDQPSTVGFVHWRKLVHMVDDAFQARSTGAYDPATQQPVSGRVRHGGQKVGKMELWALQSHGARHNLREFLSVKADDVVGRQAIYEAIVGDREEEVFRAPESASILVRELRAVGLDPKYVAGGHAVDIDAPYDVNEVDEVQIAFASPSTIRHWSMGEVVSETAFHGPTSEPVSGGLFCPRIFGPAKPFQCTCGRLQGQNCIGETCAECGEAVLDAHARLRRMGHIELAVPVLHPWVLAADPNPLALLLGIRREDLEDVVYGRQYIVLDPGDTSLRRGQLLDDEGYRAALHRLAGGFRAATGAEAIIQAAESADARAVGQQAIQGAAAEARSQTAETVALLQAFMDGSQAWRNILIEALPVLPAGLRPAVRMGAERTAMSDLNELYERVVRRNNRLKALQKMSAPDIMVRDEQRLLQEAVCALFGNGYRGRSFRGAHEMTLSALSDRLKGPGGRFVQGLAGKRTDYSARTTIAPGTSLRFDECAVPAELAIEVFRPFVVGELIRTGQARSRSTAERMVDRQQPEARRALQSVVHGRVILLIRAPALHKYSVLAFRPVLTDERVIRIHPNVTIGFNADYDGDQMTIHVPLSAAAQEEARRLLMPPRNLFGTASGALMNRPSQEIILGCYYMTIERPGAHGEGLTFSDDLEARNAWKAGRVATHARISVSIRGETVQTTPGRVLFNHLLPEELGFINEPVGIGQLQTLITQTYVKCGPAKAAGLVDAVKEFGFHHSTLAGISIWRGDPSPCRDPFFAEMNQRLAELDEKHGRGEITDEARYLGAIDLWSESQSSFRESVLADLAAKDAGFFPVSLMLRSGARGNAQQVGMLFGTTGLVADTFGRIVEFPIRDCVMSGFSEMSYFLKANGARAGLAMTSVRIAPAGDLMRRIVEAIGDVLVVEPDCGTSQGVELGAVTDRGRVAQSLSDRLAGRIAAQDIHGADEKVILRQGEEITDTALAEIRSAQIERVAVRSPLTCQSLGGVCARCYGEDPGQKRIVEVGAPVGITAALSLGEPLTQLTMRSFHLGHRYPFSWVARGRPEQDIKYSSGFPRLEEVFEMFEKRRAYGPGLDGVDERPSPQSILEQQGAMAAAQYLVEELTRVYAESGVRINGRHFEIAARQMMAFVEVVDPGDASFIPGQRIPDDTVREVNRAVSERGTRPTQVQPVLLPISEVALRSGSFLAASASWQTVRVLTEAALCQDADPLKGARENILLGRLVPIGRNR